MSQAALCETLELDELLRRCHRDELLPLVGALRVNPSGLGLAKLATVTAWALRRAGGNEVGNAVLRGGKGPPYPELLADLARRHGLEHGGGIEGTELKLLAWWMKQAWTKLDLRQREELWMRLDLNGEPPETPSEALDRAHEALGPGFGYKVGMLAAGGVARIASV